MIKSLELSGLAALYEKKILNKKNNIYYYRFIDVIGNPTYNEKENTISVMMDHKLKNIYNMCDPEFTISDKKYCFAEFMEIDELNEKFSVLEDNLIVEQYKNMCQSELKFSVLQNNSVKIVSIAPDKFKNVSNNKLDDFIVREVKDQRFVIFKQYVIEEMIKYLDEGDIEAVQNTLKSIITELDSPTIHYDEEGNYEYDVEMQMLDNYLGDVLAADEYDINCDVQFDEYDNETELDELIGLKNVKDYVSKLTNYLEYMNTLENEIILEEPNLNMVFKGNPGTGKTTIAKILAGKLYELGYVEEEKFKVATSQDFIGAYVGQTAIKTKNLLDKMKGGIVFIDEAYSFNSQGQEFADEALAELMVEMQKRDIVFIFAGYSKEMDDFLEMNPGFKSRIGKIVDFDDYSVEELMQMFKAKIEKARLKIQKTALEAVKEKIEIAKQDKHFGNGRFIDNLFNEIIIEQGQKIMKTDNIEKLKTITKNEVINAEISKPKVKTLGF